MIDGLRDKVTFFNNNLNRWRKRQAYDDYQVMMGLQKSFVRSRLKELYPKNYTRFRIGDISIAKKVNEKLSRAYSQQPSRVVSSGQDALDKIYAGPDFFQAFKEFDMIYNYFKYAFMWVRHYPSMIPGEMGRYSLRALKPYEFDVVFSESGEIECFAICYDNMPSYVQQYFTNTFSIYNSHPISFKQDLGDCLFSVWTKDEINLVRGGANNAATVLAEMPNELGAIPGAYLQQETKPEYPLPQILSNQTIEWNVAFSDLKTAAATQGHGQLVVKYPIKTEKAPKVEVGMYNAMALPQLHPDQGAATEAEYISAKPDINGQLEVLKFDLMQILEDHGLRGRKSVSVNSVEQFASGFDRLISEADVQYIIDNNQSLYAEKLEQSVFKVLKQFELKMGRTELSSAERLEIKFDKPKVLISDRETLENLAMRVKLGVVASWEKHKIIDPNLTDEEAKERESMIEADTKKLMKEGLLPPVDPGMNGMSSANMAPKKSDSDAVKNDKKNK